MSIVLVPLQSPFVMNRGFTYIEPEKSATRVATESDGPARMTRSHELEITKLKSATSQCPQTTTYIKPTIIMILPHGRYASRSTGRC